MRKAITIISRLGKGAIRVGFMKTTILSINIGKHGKRIFVVSVSSKSPNPSDSFIGFYVL